VTLEDFLLTFYWGQKVGGMVWDEKEQINFGGNIYEITCGP
jgi:hypothetical protein